MALVDPRQHLEATATRVALRIQQRIMDVAREFLRKEGFVELLQPLVGPFTDPGARGSKQVDVDYYGHRYKVMTSGIFYKQASLIGFEKIFYIAPNLRLEPPPTAMTNRHLVQFHQLDVEVRDASRESVMSLAERVLTTAAAAVAGMADEGPREEGEPVDVPEPASTPFERIDHAAAVSALQEMGYPQSADAEIDWEGEALLSDLHVDPFFIMDYPRGSRGFYDRESREQTGILRNFDLIAPRGYGELASGGEREYEYRRIVERIRETGENPDKYGWYVELARDGIPPSAGFGIGIERLTRYLGGFRDIRQATAFPKPPGVAAP
jgi:asparaginyl-tRNA synthetase